MPKAPKPKASKEEDKRITQLESTISELESKLSTSLSSAMDSKDKESKLLSELEALMAETERLQSLANQAPKAQGSPLQEVGSVVSGVLETAVSMLPVVGPLLTLL